MNRRSCRFLCDENVNRKVVEALRRRRIDAVHVLDLDMMSADDIEVMAAAAADERILLTRDYTDFEALISVYSLRGVEFPGVLFISPSITQGDVGTLLQAVVSWIHHYETGESSIRNTADWLTLPNQDDGFDRQVREAMEPYLTVLERITSRHPPQNRINIGTGGEGQEISSAKVIK